MDEDSKKCFIHCNGGILLKDRVERRVTSASFRKKAWRKGTPWSDLETDLFYDILRATGPDFGIMHEFFPSRTRAELKTKFNKEERTNWARLKKVSVMSFY
uniref:Myb-like domain-containing protein n=1 Tax=Parascaris equorum TaxID=6256 RepID=A0A914RSM4_PAREQ